jgi:hypothetical protein
MVADERGARGRLVGDAGKRGAIASLSSWPAQGDDAVFFGEKTQHSTDEWWKQVEEARRMDEAIEENLRNLGYGS